MATLEKTKTYGLEAKTQTLLDLSRHRLNAPTPHQVRTGAELEHIQLAILLFWHEVHV
jgi:hypothetical protein